MKISNSATSGRVLVTGASGFIGRRMISELIQNQIKPLAWVRTPIVDSSRLFGGDAEVKVGSLDEAGDYVRKNSDIVAVIHLAAVVAPHRRSTAFHTNVELTCKLASAISKRSSPPILVYISSLAAGGPSHESCDRIESDLPEPRSIYGESKLAAERALSNFASKIPISIVRPPGVFGPWDRNLLQLFRTVRAGWNFVGVSKRFRYSFVHVEDLANGVLSVLDHGKRLKFPAVDEFSTLRNNQSISGACQSRIDRLEAYPTCLNELLIDSPLLNSPPGRVFSKLMDSQGLYYIADPKPVNFVELANMVADSMGKRMPRHITLPAWMCWPLALASEAGGRCLNVKTFLNIDKMREAVAGNWTCDTAKATSELGFSVAADLKQRVNETANWYSENGWIKYS